MTITSRNAVGWLVLLGGLLSAAPSACVLIYDSSDADEQVALGEVIRLPFEGLKSAGP
jgi:hypothetical protein